jgi:predicted amidohydrolase YtcJ
VGETRTVVVGGSIGIPGTPGDAILVRGGTIAAVGTAASFEAPTDLHPDGVILPGLRDAHLHPVGYTASLHRPSLKNASGFGDIEVILSEAAASQPAGTAVTALRLDDETLAEGRLPDRRLLDRAVPDRPALIVRYCGHVSVANTAALEIAGIGPDTPDPAGGIIDRGPDGLPTGVLRETAADLVSGAIRSQSPPVTASDLLGATTALASVGLTSVGGVVDTRAGCWAGGGSELEALLEVGPDLPIRVAALVIAGNTAELERAAQRLEDAGPRLSFLGWKAFADGSLGGHTAAMFEPFSDRPDTRGTHRLDPSWAAEMARAAVALGGRVAIHAIGDAANARVVDLMEGLIEQGTDPARLRVEHASVLTRRDIGRIGDLGITAVVQPAFLASEAGWLAARVGGRLPLTYPFRSLAEAGAPLAGSSDSPVEPPHPLWGMAAARDRCGVVPEEGLDAAAAFGLFTTGAAAAIGERARIEEGEPADLVVLDRSPLATGPDGLREARVLATYVGGERIAVPEGSTAWQA